MVQNILRHRHPNELRIHKRRKDRGGGKAMRHHIAKMPARAEDQPDGKQHKPAAKGFRQRRIPEKQKRKAKHRPCQGGVKGLCAQESPLVPSRVTIDKPAMESAVPNDKNMAG